MGNGNGNFLNHCGTLPIVPNCAKKQLLICDHRSPPPNMPPVGNLDHELSHLMQQVNKAGGGECIHKEGQTQPLC